MSTMKIFTSTIKFPIMIAVTALAVNAVGVILMAISLGIMMFVSPSMGGVLMWISAFVWAIIDWFVNHYFAYLLKAGHIAVITETVATGQVPDNYFEYGKEKVKTHFVQANAYFALDKLVTGAVAQVSRGINTIGSLLSNIPGMSNLVSIVNMFMRTFLGYIDECCLGWAFYNEGQSPYKSAADGVSIYAKEWKALSVNAIKITLGVYVMRTVILILLLIVNMVPLWILLGEAGVLVGLFGAVMGYVIALRAVIDPFTLISVNKTFMEVAPYTQIEGTLYNNLCNMSKSFKKLFEQGGSDTSGYGGIQPAMAGVPNGYIEQQPVQQGYLQQQVQQGMQYGTNQPQPMYQQPQAVYPQQGQVQYQQQNIPQQQVYNQYGQAPQGVNQYGQIPPQGANPYGQVPPQGNNRYGQQ